MRVRSVICSLGRSGYMHRDLLAIKSGAKQDGFVFHGKALVSRFRKDRRAGDHRFGDARAGGRPDRLRGLRRCNSGRRRRPRSSVPWRGSYRLPARRDRCPFSRAATLPSSAITPRTSISTARGGKLLHTAVRYGLTQALLHATALAQQKDHGGNHRRGIRQLHDLEAADPDPGLRSQG